MQALRARQSTAALALEHVILTACRSGEVLNAQWSEFDLDKKVWTIPAIRMKAGYSIAFPCLTGKWTFSRASKLDHNLHVFPGTQRGKPLSSMAMAMQLRTHGA